MNGLTSIVNVARKNGGLEGGWMQRRLSDIGWSDDISKCQACHRRRKALKKHRLYHCPEWYEVQEAGAKSENLKKGMEVAKRYC